MLLKKIKGYKLLLGSQSPRRKELLENAGFDFDVCHIEVEESYESALRPKKIASYLSKKKALAYPSEIAENEILITADTIVVFQARVLGKPANTDEAKEMLRQLSGKKHEVISGFCLRSKDKLRVYSSCTEVVFSKLSEQEIDYYVHKYKPMDKAGGYGIQEWIGHIGIKKIEGSYFNVMGLPIQKLYRKLEQFISS